MLDKNERIETYLELEALLLQIYEQVDYCIPNCIETEQTSGAADQVAYGCCIRNYVNPDQDELEEFYESSIESIELLNRAREEEHGNIYNPSLYQEAEGYCDCHTAEGCILPNYKPPICVAFTCQQFDTYVRNEFGIDLPNHEERMEILMSVLDGTIDPKEYDTFKSQLEEIVAITA